MVKAERFHQEWGTSIQLTVEQQPFPPDMSLQAFAGTAVQMQHIDKKRKTQHPEGLLVLQIKQAPAQHIAIKPKGSFLFEFLDDTPVCRPAIVTDATGTPVPLDTRLWFPQTLSAVDQGTVHHVSHRGLGPSTSTTLCPYSMGKERQNMALEASQSIERLCKSSSAEAIPTSSSRDSYAVSPSVISPDSTMVLPHQANRLPVPSPSGSEPSFWWVMFSFYRRANRQVE